LVRASDVGHPKYDPAAAVTSLLLLLVVVAE
jgi:hypothetical protein